MLQKFKTYYQKHNLFIQADKILLAVSGGKDSMAMLQLFIESKLNFGVAHCNFNLRAEASDGDEQLVKMICKKNNISFYQNSFDTKEYADKNGISIQMAARDLRYNWFGELCVKNDYQYIATAHHKNDVAETMLINLAKGTGLAGLHGIRRKSGKIIRPLLDFTREEIDVFAQENKIKYREDQSNTDNKYSRNGVRLDVIPLLEKINPNLIESLNQTANYLSEAELILEEKINEEFDNCSEQIKNRIIFDIEKLQGLTTLSTYLYYFIKAYGFNAADVADIIQSFKEQSGKIFLTKTHQLVKDREQLILTSIFDETGEELIINNVEKLVEYGFSSEVCVYDEHFKINKSAQFANLDADKIKFPLVLRNWREGDTFQPLGMKGKKKLSDFFIDNKVDVFTKQQIKILTQNNQIIWVVGFRIADVFKISKTTKKVLVINAH